MTYKGAVPGYGVLDWICLPDIKLTLISSYRGLPGLMFLINLLHSCTLLPCRVKRPALPAAFSLGIASGSLYTFSKVFEKQTVENNRDGYPSTDRASEE